MDKTELENKAVKKSKPKTKKVRKDFNFSYTDGVRNIKVCLKKGQEIDQNLPEGILINLETEGVI